MEQIIETRNCLKCKSNFDVTDWDQDFYNKMQVPRPTLCPFCREQLRSLQINHFNLFKRKCDGNGKDIVSHYPPDAPFRVYSQEYWFGGEYDGTKYGKGFDFNKPFFEQFLGLHKLVPRRALFTDYFKDENAQYTNYSGKNKNCYLIFDSDENWDCLYSYGLNSSKSSADCNRCVKLELCYEAVDSNNCYDCSFVYNCENCSDSLFLNNCIGCKNCLFCSNLKNKEYHIFNKPATKEQYEKAKKEISSHKRLNELTEQFQKYKLQFPQKYMRGFQNENSTGNYLNYCKNANNCFDSMKIWDGKYCYRVFTNAKNCMDCNEIGDEMQLIYESNVIIYNGYQIRFSTQCIHQNSNLDYCDNCTRSQNLFGCVGLNGKKYCILNKQYSKEEYEQLVPEIIEHMKKTKEWGENFPAYFSTHPYNLSVAQDYYPLTKEQAMALGYKWRDPDKKEFKPQKYQTPDNIQEVSADILQEILACHQCAKNYKIVEIELNFCKKQNLPVPRLCFECRHKNRMNMRNLSRKLYERNCRQCHSTLQTTYSPDRPEIIYCEKCYQESIV